MSLLAVAAFSAGLTVAHVDRAPSLHAEDGWSAAAATPLDWDFTDSRPAPETTDVRVLVDEQNLYVRFDARQREPIVATQQVDDVGQGSDDAVHVSLWPAGPGGFEYTFEANPRGTHYQSSSENTTFAPTWTSVGTIVDGGYRVTMRIPLRVIRGDGRATWTAQFTRTIKNAGVTLEWAHAPGQSGTDVVAYAGTLSGLASAAKAARTRPRLGVYALGEAGTPATGGSTSRTGLDLALPITQTSSLVATVHPDFSNVESDQQTIAPTTFRRQYTEVRPFFAQGANVYDYSNCYGCPGGATELYTPAIPTPRTGYELEGKQGAFTFGALDAIGDGRTDDAQSIVYATSDRSILANFTRAASEQRGVVHDVTDYGFLAWTDHKRWSGYIEEGFEHGSLVHDPVQARRYNGGFAYTTKDDFWSVSAEHVGAQYDPVDGFVSVGDIAGYSAQGSHTWRFASGPVQSFTPSFYVERYHGSDGFGTNLFDDNLSLSLFLRDKLSAAASVGTSFYRVPGDPSLHPNNQQGLRVDYLLNSAQQSTLAWNGGRFGNGYLSSSQAQTGLRLSRRTSVALFAYGTNYRGSDGTDVQWLERASVTYDLGTRSSLVAGVRKIVGTAPPFPGSVPAFTNATNLSFGFSARRTHDDVYLVYGDASALQTRPALTLKLVHYFGAEKGT